MTRLSHLPAAVRRRATLLLVLCAACFTSPSPRRAALADRHRGDTISVQLTDGRSRVGELLGVRDSSLVLLIGDRIVAGPFADIADVMINRQSGRSIRPGTSAASTQLSRASRFPFGMSAAALSALLAQARQAAPDPLIGQR